MSAAGILFMTLFWLIPLGHVVYVRSKLVHAEGGGADGEPGGGGGGAAAAQEPEPPAEGIAMSLFRDVESIIGAFFASLLPSWRPDDYPDIPPEPQQPMAAGPGANF